mmetsp:Transcript_8536/g.14487  ORF Transcript_8536/g.14487 Transcript_8536/m.14487 type:complete len:209 (+) Transcript_8536:109-735(+)
MVLVQPMKAASPMHYWMDSRNDYYYFQMNHCVCWMEQHDCYADWDCYCWHDHLYLISCHAVADEGGRDDDGLDFDPVAIAPLFDHQMRHYCNYNCFVVAFRYNTAAAAAEDDDYHDSADHVVDDIAGGCYNSYHHVYRFDHHDHSLDYVDDYFLLQHHSKTLVLRSSFYYHNYFDALLLYRRRRRRRDDAVAWCHLRAASGDFSIFRT